jgi:hypothetical protein
MSAGDHICHVPEQGAANGSIGTALSVGAAAVACFSRARHIGWSGSAPTICGPGANRSTALGDCGNLSQCASMVRLHGVPMPRLRG